MEYGSAVHDGSSDRCGRYTGSKPITDRHPGADGSRRARRWPSVGEHRLEGLSLPWRPLVWEDESWRVYA
jgi:hypothetical protein